MAKNESAKGMTTANFSVRKATPVTAQLPVKRDYQAEDDHRTLMEAEHIKADPVKMTKVREIAGRKVKAAQAIHKLTDIKAASRRLRATGDSGIGRGMPDPEAEMHHETLTRAHSIMADPKRMAGVKTIAASKYAASKAVHSMAAKMSDGDGDEK